MTTSSHWTNGAIMPHRGSGFSLRSVVVPSAYDAKVLPSGPMDTSLRRPPGNTVVNRVSPVRRVSTWYTVARPPAVVRVT